MGTISPNDITVFYVPKFNIESTLGEAVFPSVFLTTEQQYLNNVFMRGQGAINESSYILAHEIGHVLTNKAHFGDNTEAGEYQHNVEYDLRNNLMTSIPVDFYNVDSSKRLTEEQETLILNNYYFEEDE